MFFFNLMNKMHDNEGKVWITIIAFTCLWLAPAVTLLTANLALIAWGIWKVSMVGSGKR